MTFTEVRVEKVVADVRARMAEFCARAGLGVGPDYAGCCLYWAGLTVARLKAERGLRPQVQVGTALWPRVPPALDDGVSPSHFGYEWDPDSPLSRMSVRLFGNLPEMHAWVGLPEGQVLIDLTTGSWPEACRRGTGLPWLAPRPPAYLWAPGCQLPEGVVYRAADAGAFCFAARTMQDVNRRHGPWLAAC